MEKIQWTRTDLLDETDEFINHRSQEQREKLRESSGIHVSEEVKNLVKLTRVEVDKEGERQIGKKPGKYITLTIPTLTADDEEGFKAFQKVLIEELQSLHASITQDVEQKVLIIGLGNRIITPDAVGPLAIDQLQNQFTTLQDKCMIYAPGVTGQTGYETSDFVKALAGAINPSLIIIIDALATRASSRLCKTVQITNTGIHPGSGVGNARLEISEDTIGCPVTAIGLPTVVDGPVIIADAIDVLFQSIAAKIDERKRPSRALSVTSWRPMEGTPINVEALKPIFGEWSGWSKEDRLQLFEEVLVGHDRLFVTPKNIDEWVASYSLLIANTLTAWLAPE